MKIQFKNEEYSVRFSYVLEKEEFQEDGSIKTSTFVGKKAFHNANGETFGSKEEMRLTMLVLGISSEKLQTECLIEKRVGEKDNIKLASATAIRSQCDPIIKRIGRKISLSRALAKLPTELNNKEFRSEVWKRYLAEHKH